jgi:hypothetical protein
MRTMSWSRYHCLCWSFLRIRMRLRGKRIAIRSKRTRGSRKSEAGNRHSQLS